MSEQAKMPEPGPDRWSKFSDDEVAVVMLALQTFAASDVGFDQAREEMLTEATRTLQRRIREGSE